MEVWQTNTGLAWVYDYRGRAYRIKDGLWMLVASPQVTVTMAAVDNPIEQLLFRAVAYLRGWFNA